MPELDLLKTPASSQQPNQAQGKKRKQSPALSQSGTNSQQQTFNLPPKTLTQPTISDFFSANQNSTTRSNKSSRASTPPLSHTLTTSPKRYKTSGESDSEIFKTASNLSIGAETRMLNIAAPKKVIDLTDSSSQPGRSTEGTNVLKTKSGNSTVTPRPPVFQSHTGPRKLTVKNLRQSPKTSLDAYYHQTWKSLHTALTAIFTDQTVSHSLEELYRGVENLCRGDKAGPTYEKLRKRIDEHIGGKLKQEVNERAGRSDNEVVKAVEAAWSVWCYQLGMIRSIFFYLDRSYLLSSPTLPSIWDTGLNSFKHHIADDPKIGPKFLRGIFNLFSLDRQTQGGNVNISLLLSCIRMISSLGLYSTKFEPQFINVSREYFAQVAKQESVSQNLAGYLSECASQLDRETVRCEKFQLESSTRREIISVLEDEMVRKPIRVLVDVESVGELLEKRDEDSLGKLYSLVDRVEDAGNRLKAAWEKYIVKFGSAIIHDDKDADIIPRLLDFKASLDKILFRAFRKNDTLSHSLRDSFTNFINARNPKAPHKNNSRASEMIAKYVDLLLRHGIKALPATAVDAKKPNQDEAVETGAGDEDALLGQQLDAALDLFRFIQGKDVFEAFYKKDLARRLLMGRSASADAERSMLAKLKSECGSNFTHNLESMFKDIELSKDAMTSFKTSKYFTEKSSGVGLNVNILSMSAWPTYPDIPVILPQDLAECLESFKDFYLGKHKGRKLVWRHGLAQCVLKANLPKGRKELVVSAFQGVCLLLFNDVEQGQSLSYSAIMEATGLPDKELNRTLQSLACAKYKILRKNPKGRDVNVTDTFTLDRSFTDEKFRIKINQIQLKETKEEQHETHERVAQDRQYETQAAIIRIMKSRKVIKHQELIQQTIEQTKSRGVLDVAEIKKNIEKLIDKDYMERLENNTYKYIS